MQVKRSSEVKARPVQGAPGVTVRWLWPPEEGEPDFALQVLEIDPGAGTPRHSHSHKHEIYVLRGQARLEGPKESHQLGPNDSAVVEPFEEHQVFNAADEPLQFVCALSQPTETAAISAQVSLYPLRQVELTPAIEAALATFHLHGLEVLPGPMSTLLSGPTDLVFRALQEAFLAAAATGDVVMSVAFSNACPPATLEEGTHQYHFEPIGQVHSSCEEPMSPDILKREETKLVLDPPLKEGLKGLKTGDRILVLFGFHLSRGYELTQHPRGDESRPKRGVFALRSPHRPCPIGVSEVEVVGLKDNVIRVRGLDALNHSPVFDIKPA